MGSGIGRLLSWGVLGSTGVGAVPAVAGCQSTRRRLPAPRSEESPFGRLSAATERPRDRTGRARFSPAIASATGGCEGWSMRARLVAASGLATVLATGSTALAAPPWSEPRDVGATSLRLSQPDDRLRYGRDGAADAGSSTRRSARLRRHACGPASRAWRRDGSVVDRRHAPGRAFAAALARCRVVYGRNRTVVLRARAADARTGGTRVRLDAVFGTTARPLGGRFRRAADVHASIGDWEGPALAAAGATARSRSRGAISGRVRHGARAGASTA